MNTAELISEVEEHLLGGDRDEINRLSNAMDASQTTVTVDFPLQGATQGSYLCADLEVMYVWSVDNTSQVATIQRGVLGSTAATHASGTIVYVNPLFNKWAIFKALNVEVLSLSGADNGLFAEKSFTVITQPVQATYDVPALNLDLRQILEIRWDAVGPERYWPRVSPRNFSVIRDVTTDTGTSGMSIRIDAPSFIPGRRMVIRYAGNFIPLTSTLTDDASLTGLGPTMLDIPAMGAAARLMGVREAKRTFIERSVDSRRAQEVPPGSSSRAAGVLLQLLNGRIKSEAARLRQLWPDQSY